MQLEKDRRSRKSRSRVRAKGVGKARIGKTCLIGLAAVSGQ